MPKHAIQKAVRKCNDSQLACIMKTKCVCLFVAISSMDFWLVFSRTLKRVITQDTRRTAAVVTHPTDFQASA